MKILYYDCFAGISGDMNLGALMDIGVDSDYLLNEMSKLGLDGYRIDIKKDLKQGIYGTKVNVILNQQNPHQNNHNHHHHHRTLNEINGIIGNANFSSRVKDWSKAIFKVIGEAEAKIHNKNIEEIHFHEVGALDSIIDIVGAAICIDYLKPDKIFCSPVQLGGGFVKCAHGTFPVPAPATAEILKNIPVKKGAVDFESTTPTGAGIVSVLADSFTEELNFEIEKIGYGIGFKDADVPNVLRIYLGEIEDNYTNSASAQIIECNIDDMNPEIYDYVFEQLFKAGAHDVYITPIIMKKSRPAVTISVLCDVSKENAIEEILFTETSTIGIRKYQVTKSMLERKFTTLDTDLGTVNIKSSYYKNKLVKSKPEYEDCLKIAKERKIPISQVYKRIQEHLAKNAKSK